MLSHQSAHKRQPTQKEAMVPPLKRRRVDYSDPEMVGSAVRDPAPHFAHQVNNLYMRPARIPHHVEEVHVRTEKRSFSPDGPQQIHNRQNAGTAGSSSASSTDTNLLIVSVAVSADVNTSVEAATTSSSTASPSSKSSSADGTSSSRTDGTAASATSTSESLSSFLASSASSSKMDSVTNAASTLSASNKTSSLTVPTSSAHSSFGSNFTTSATTITSAGSTFTSQTTFAFPSIASSAGFNASSLSISSSTSAAFVYAATLSNGSVQNITQYGHAYATTLADGDISTIAAAATTHRTTTATESSTLTSQHTTSLVPSSARQSTATSDAMVSDATASTGATGAGIHGTTTSAAPISTPTVTNDSVSNTPPAGTIAGGVVGGCAGLAAILLVAMLFLRWYRRRAQLGHQALPPNSAGLQGPGGPPTSRGAGMAQRAGLMPLVGAIPGLLRHQNRSGPALSPEPSERGFQRVSGRKLPSAYSEGMHSPPAAAPLTGRARDLSTTSFYQDNDGFYGGEGPFTDEAAVGDAGLASRSHEAMTLSPGPRRTPTIHAGGPYSLSSGRSDVGGSVAGTAATSATYDRTDTPSISDVNRNSRFTEQV